MTSGQPSAFGTLLRRYRTTATLTQQELAEWAGISVRGLVALENGERLRPRPDTVRLLADALRLDDRARRHFEAVARGRCAASGGDLGQQGAEHSGAGQRGPSTNRTGPFPTPLVGRTAELELLERHAAGIGPPVLVLAGEPGIGKTRLLRHAAEQAAHQGRAVFAGGCLRRSGQEPYAPVPQALARHLTPLPAATVKESLRESGRLVWLLPELAPLLPDPVAPSSLEASQERRLLFDAVVRLLARLAHPAGAVLLLDDLHWAPTDTLDLLTALVHDPSSAQLRVVCAYRSTEVQPSHPLALLLADLAHAGLARQWAVEALSPDEAQQLLASLVDGLDPRSAAVHRAVGRTGGVPFYLVSFAEDWRRQGAAPTDDVPWDVAHSLRQRVAALPSLAREILGVAAVAGRVAPRALLQRVIGRPEVEILAGLEAVCRASLLAEAGDHAYRFPHDVIREVVEADLGAARRTLLHRRIGEVLEQLPERDRGKRVADLAWHFVEGDLPERALAYALVAGDAARTTFAHNEAEGQYRTAAQLALELGDQPREAEASEQLGRMLWSRTSLDEAVDRFERAAGIYHQLGDREAEGRVTAALGWALSARGTPEEAIRRIRPVVRILDDVGPSRALVDLYAALLHLYVRQARPDDLIVAAERAAEVAQAVGDPRPKVQAALGRGVALCTQGRFDEALQVVEPLIPLAEAQGDLLSFQRAVHWSCLISTSRGQFETSASLLTRALDLLERRGDLWDRADILLNLGSVRYLQGNWAAARSLYEQAATLFHAPDRSFYSGWAQLALTELSLAEGKWDEASRHSEAALTIIEATGDRQSVPEARRLAAERALLQGQPEAARAQLEPVLAGSALPIVLREDAQVPQTLAEAHVMLADPTAAKGLIAAGVERARSTKARVALAGWLRIVGTCAAQQGDCASAISAFEESLLLARCLSAPYLEGRVLYDWGRLAVTWGASRQARAHLDAALTIFRRLGAQPYIRRTEEAGRRGPGLSAGTRPRN